MNEIISAVLKLIGLSGRAYRSGQGEMGHDFLDAALGIAEKHDLNINKIIKEKQKHDLDANPDSKR